MLFMQAVWRCCSCATASLVEVSSSATSFRLRAFASTVLCSSPRSSRASAIADECASSLCPESWSHFCRPLELLPTWASTASIFSRSLFPSACTSPRPKSAIFAALACATCIASSCRISAACASVLLARSLQPSAEPLLEEAMSRLRTAKACSTASTRLAWSSRLLPASRHLCSAASTLLAAQVCDSTVLRRCLTTPSVALRLSSFLWECLMASPHNCSTAVMCSLTLSNLDQS
mmetsp:Transcript_48560/g.128305  ORF Transcript_48560/g.128305 Transcript_48560/m.128305 type:complete len:234 (-) Transcript_48560:535-1236(-)